MQTTTRRPGGRRDGAGAPPKYSDPGVSRSIRLPPDAWAIIDQQDGSYSDRLVATILSTSDCRRLREALEHALGRVVSRARDRTERGRCRPARASLSTAQSTLKEGRT